MYLSKLLLVTSLLATATAFAESGESNTKFFGQTAADKTSVELKYSSAATSSIKLKTTGGADAGDLKISTSAFRFELQHGFSSDLSAGIWTDFGTNTTSTTGSTDQKDTGMGDINLFMLGNSPQGSFNLHYGAEFGLSMGEKKNAATSPAKDGSRNSGGMHLTPMVGMLFPMSSMNAGFKLTYEYKMERSVNDQGTPATTSKVTGGNEFSIIPFFEYNHGAGFLGLSIDLASIGKEETKTGGATTSTPAYATTTFSLYGTYLPSPEFELGLGYDYNQTKSREVSSNLEKISYTSSGFNIWALYTF